MSEFQINTLRLVEHLFGKTFDAEVRSYFDVRFQFRQLKFRAFFMGFIPKQFAINTIGMLNSSVDQKISVEVDFMRSS